MLEHIQRGLHIPAGETLGKRTLFDDFGARGVDEQCARLDMFQRLRGDDALRCGEQRHMQRDDVGALEHLAHIVDRRDPEPRDRVLVKMRVPYEHLHAETLQHTCEHLADAAESHQSDRLAMQSVTVGAFPAAGMHLAVEIADVPGEFHQQCERVLGDRMIAVAHDVAHTHAALSGSLQVDVARDTCAAECEATHMDAFSQPVEDRIGDMESDDHHGVGVLATADDGVFVECEIAVHAQTDHVVQQADVLLEIRNHGGNDHRHDRERQIGAFGLCFDDWLDVGCG